MPAIGSPRRRFRRNKDFCFVWQFQCCEGFFFLFLMFFRQKCARVYFFCNRCGLSLVLLMDRKQYDDPAHQSRQTRRHDPGTWLCCVCGWEGSQKSENEAFCSKGEEKGLWCRFLLQQSLMKSPLSDGLSSGSGYGRVLPAASSPG